MQKFSTMINLLKDNILTNKLFLNPVLAEDNVIYERNALIKYLVENNYTSPINPNQKISFKTIQVIPIASMVDLFIQQFPELKKDQYTVTDTNMVNYKMLHINHIDDINGLFESRNYDEIQNFTEFNLNIIENLDTFIKRASIDTIKYLIDNTVDLSVPINKDDDSVWYFINFVAEYGSFDVFKYLVAKPNVDINAMRADTYTVIHQLTHNRYREIDMIKFAVESGANVNTLTKNGYSAVYIIINFCGFDMILYALERCDPLNQEQKSAYLDIILKKKFDDETMGLLTEIIFNK